MTAPRARTLVASVVLVAAVLASEAAPSAGLTGSDPGNRKRDVDRSIGQVRSSMEDTGAALAAAQAAVDEVAPRVTAAQGAHQRAQQAVARARADDLAVTAQLQLAQADEAKAHAELAADVAALATTRQRVGALARTQYQTSGMTQLSIALQATSPDDFATRLVLADTVQRVQGDVLGRLRAQEADNRALGARLTAVRSQVELFKRQAVAAVAATAASRRRADAARRALLGVQHRRQTLLVTLQARRVQEQARLDELQAQSRSLQVLLDRIAAQERARAAEQARRRRQAGRPAEPPSDRGTGVLMYPVRAPITSGFGMRFHPILHYARLHAGVDFGVACGKPVRAAAAGTIVRAGPAGGYGNQVVIDHGVVDGKGLATSYDHLSRISAHGGARVTRGQVIGKSGTTGLSTGCHLHFETRQNGVPVDPMKWL